MGEMTMQAITFIKDELGLKAGVWAWQGTPINALEQYIVPFVDIIEYETRVKGSREEPARYRSDHA